MFLFTAAVIMEYSAFEDQAPARLCTKGKAITFPVLDSGTFFLLGFLYQSPLPFDVGMTLDAAESTACT